MLDLAAWDEAQQLVDSRYRLTDQGIAQTQVWALALIEVGGHGPSAGQGECGEQQCIVQCFEVRVVVDQRHDSTARLEISHLRAYGLAVA